MNLNTTIKNDYIYEYLSNTYDVKGVIHISHGMAEHIDRYESFAEKLNSFGFHVVGHNHLGHGENKENGEGIFSPSKGWSKVCNEACMVNEHFCNLYPELPSYLFGHSMGAFITCLLYTSPSPRDLSTSRMPSSA